MSADSSRSTGTAPPAFPGWGTRIVVAVSLVIVLAMRMIRRLEDPPWDNAVSNIVSLIFAFVALAALWLWAYFQACPTRSARRWLVVGTALVVALAVGLFRVVEVSGDMWPRLALRFGATPDRQLGKVAPQAAVAQADLATTTPHDFPGFLGPSRSNWIAGPALARDWTAEPPELLWKQPIGAGWSAFAAVNGYAVTLEQRGDDEWVACYEIGTGKPVWGHAIAARHENALGGIGPRSTPTIHAGRVYALGATGVLCCLDGATGKLLWSDDLQARYGLTQAEDEALVQWGRAASPLIVDALVVVPGGGPAGKAKNLVAFAADTGRLVWEAENRLPEGAADQIAYASPILATLAGRRQILIVNESTASGHDPATGERLWSHPWPGRSNMNASSSQPVPIGDNQVLLSKGYGGGAELLELSAAGEGLAVKTRWKNPRVLQTKFSNVVVHGDHIYALSEGILECVELATGQRKWKAGRYNHGQILGVGELLLVLSEDGRLALVALSPERHQQLGQIEALEGKTWNNLCLFGNQLLVRNGEQAACFVLK
jgi:outer membrane protein assembly factor BamB